MDAYQAIISKRDTRHFTPEPIPEDVLTRILQAGRMAGSSNFSAGALVVLRDCATRAALGPVAITRSTWRRAPVPWPSSSLPGEAASTPAESPRT